MLNLEEKSPSLTFEVMTQLKTDFECDWLVELAL